MHNEDRSNGCCALVFSPSRAGRGNSFRVGETSLLSVPFRLAWADLIGGRSADRRRILTRVCGQGISSQREREKGEDRMDFDRWIPGLRGFVSQRKMEQRNSSMIMKVIHYCFVNKCKSRFFINSETNYR